MPQLHSMHDKSAFKGGRVMPEFRWTHHKLVISTLTATWHMCTWDYENLLVCHSIGVNESFLA